MIGERIVLAVAMAAVSVAAAMSAAESTRPASAPADDVEYWLNQGRPATSASPATASAPSGAEAIGESAAGPAIAGPDAVPGVIELSNGKVLPGMLSTTAEKPWVVFVESEQRWRSVPFVNVLSIEAVIDEEKMEQEWRWKEMGVPERVFTGREFPTRRLLWKLHLIDDSTLTGAIKGQPLWLDLGQSRWGPWVLHERSKGNPGQKLADLVYVKRIIVSRRLMDQVLKSRDQGTGARD